MQRALVQPSGRLPSPEVAVLSVQGGLLVGRGETSRARGTHIAQVQELSLTGQTEEGRADDQVDLWEGHHSVPGQGREASQLGCPALYPWFPLPAVWAVEWPGGRAGP